MSEPNDEVCEVKLVDGWRAVSVSEAHAHHGTAAKRCPLCQGRVSTQGNYTPPMKFRLVHRKAHDGCELLPRHYAGRSRQHPQPLT